MWKWIDKHPVLSFILIMVFVANPIATGLTWWMVDEKRQDVARCEAAGGRAESLGNFRILCVGPDDRVLWTTS